MYASEGTHITPRINPNALVITSNTRAILTHGLPLRTLLLLYLVMTPTLAYHDYLVLPAPPSHRLEYDINDLDCRRGNLALAVAARARG